MSNLVSKVPQLTLAFWVTKILATTLGETGGDALSMTLGLGYAWSTAIFSVFFLIAVITQVRASAFHPFLYWAVIVTTTTVGTTMADFADRSLGMGYPGGTILLFSLLAATLVLWRWRTGSISVSRIATPEAEIFYWVAILYSNTLGTALGDFLSDSGPGYEGAALVFSAVLAVIALGYYYTNISRTALFWLAFILTRPLGATLGDLLTKTYAQGGFDLSRFSSTAVIGLAMVVSILLSSRKAGKH